MPTSPHREVALRPPGTDILATIDLLNSSEKFCMCPYALFPRLFPMGYPLRSHPYNTGATTTLTQGRPQRPCCSLSRCCSQRRSHAPSAGRTSMGRDNAGSQHPAFSGICSVLHGHSAFAARPRASPPRLLREGLTEKQVQAILIENPRRFLSR